MLSGEKLRRARKDLHLSQRDLGEIVGVSGTLIGHYENGLRSPRGKTLEKLSEALGVDPDWLMLQDADDVRDNYTVRYNSILQLTGLFADPEHGRGYLKAYSQLCYNLNELQRVVGENQIDDDADTPSEVDGDELEDLRRIETFAQNCCRSYAELKEKSPRGMLAEKENFNKWNKERQEFDFLLGEYLKLNSRGRGVCKQVIMNLVAKPEYASENGKKSDMLAVGRHLQEVRVEQGRSLEEVSKQSGILTSRLLEIEGGQGEPADGTEVSHICFVLGLSISDVIPFDAAEAERLNKLYDQTKGILNFGPNISEEYYNSVRDLLLTQWGEAAQRQLAHIRKSDTENLAEQLRTVEQEGLHPTEQ